MSIHSAPIKVVVGADQIEYFANKHLICAQSDFFETACNDQWESRRTNAVTLADTDSDIFALFLTWLLTGNIEDAEELIDMAGDDDEAKKRTSSQQFLQLAECFVLGDEIQCLTFCNHIMDQIIKIFFADFKLDCIAGTNWEAIDYIYSNTLNDSHLRMVIIDNFIDNFDFEESSLPEPDPDFPLPQRYYLDLAQRLGTAWIHKERTKSVWAKDPCTCHKHPIGEHQASCPAKGNSKRKLIPPYLSILRVTPSWSANYTLN
jgi:hypothetical protein